MTNDFWNNPAPLTRQTLARAETVEAKFAGIAAGFDKLPALEDLYGGALNFADDSGAANAYAINISPTFLVAYGLGLSVRFRATNANTGASTLNVNGLGVKALRTARGVALQAGDISAGAIVDATYDGTVFRITGLVSSEISGSAGNAEAAAASAVAAAGYRDQSQAYSLDALAHKNAALLVLEGMEELYYGPSATAPVGADIGAMYLDTSVTPNVVKVLSSTGWNPVVTVSIGGARSQVFVATSGQTVFTVDGGFSSGAVYKNGTRLWSGTSPDVTFNTTAGTFTLAVGATSGDEIMFDGYLANDTTDIYTKAESDSRFARRDVAAVFTSTIEVNGGIAYLDAQAAANATAFLRNESGDQKGGVAWDRASGKVQVFRRNPATPGTTQGLLEIDASAIVYNGQGIYHSGNFNPANYAALAGATFAGDVQVGSGAAAVTLSTAGGIEILRNANAFIDFKNSSGDDYDIRIMQDGANVLSVLASGGVRVAGAELASINAGGEAALRVETQNSGSAALLRLLNTARSFALRAVSGALEFYDEGVSTVRARIQSSGLFEILSGLAVTGTITATSTIKGTGSFYADADANRHYWMRTAAGVNQGVLFHNDANDRLTLRVYNPAGSSEVIDLELRQDGTVTINGNTVWHTGNLPGFDSGPGVDTIARRDSDGDLRGRDLVADKELYIGTPTYSGTAAVAWFYDANSGANRAFYWDNAGDSFACHDNAGAGKAVAHAGNIGTLYAAVGVGDVGTTGFLRQVSSTGTFTPGQTKAGSQLRWVDSAGNSYPDATPGGTWMCMGYTTSADQGTQSTLWRRIA